MEPITGRIIAVTRDSGRLYACVQHSSGYADIYRVAKNGQLSLMLGWSSVPAEYRERDHIIERNARGHLRHATPITDTEKDN